MCVLRTLYDALELTLLTLITYLHFPPLKTSLYKVSERIVSTGRFLDRRYFVFRGAVLLSRLIWRHREGSFPQKGTCLPC